MYLFEVIYSVTFYKHKTHQSNIKLS